MKSPLSLLILSAVLFGSLLLFIYPEWAKLTSEGSTPAMQPDARASTAITPLRPQQSEARPDGASRRSLGLVWSFRPTHKWLYRDPFKNETVEQRGGMVCTDIIVAEDRAYFGCEGGFLYCVSTDGKMLWSFETRGTRVGAPAIAGERLFFGSEDNNLYALNPITGQQVFRFDAKSEITTTPCIADGRVFFSSRQGDIFALKSDFGKELWVYEDDSGNSSSPVTDGVDVYVGTDSGKLLAIDAKTGGLKWSYDAGNAIRSAPVISGDRVFFACWDGGLFGLLKSAPHQTFVTQLDGFIKSTPAVSGAWIIAATMNGLVYAIDAASGEILWSNKCADVLEASPIVASDGRIYIGGWDGGFTALDVETGKVLVERFLGSMISCRAASWPDGKIVVGMKAGLECVFK
ncbi:PQQ-binding-like beta-propeller repeat protein [bacterium]|nr:PQQ-binding-like beta-propeller repeat protein [bacterium]